MDTASQQWQRGFIKDLRVIKHYSPHTVSNYSRDLQGIARFLASRNIENWKEVDARAVRAWIAHEHHRGQSRASVQRGLASVRALYRYLLKNGHVANNPALDLRAPKGERKLPVALDTDQMDRLLSDSGAADLNDPLNKRDMAVMELAYSSGLRLAELVSLNLPQLDLAEGTVVVTGKGNKTRVLPVGRMAIQCLQAWIEVRKSIAKNDEMALFVGKQGRRLGARAVQQRLKLWAQRQGLDRNVHPHMLRHSFASHMLESSGDLRAVQELLGHANISTTQVYTHLDFQHLANVYDAAHPRARRNTDK